MGSSAYFLVPACFMAGSLVTTVGVIFWFGSLSGSFGTSILILRCPAQP